MQFSLLIMAFGHGIGYKKTLEPQWIRGRSYSATVHEASHAMTPRKIEIGLAYLDFFQISKWALDSWMEGVGFKKALRARLDVDIGP